MKSFIATTEERYVWNCPYCGELCDDYFVDPEEEESVECEHCGEESWCEQTER
jgi:DNA-directed RNA polymerase subunit RPC12/RpoP